MKKIWDWLKESYHYAGDYVIPTEDGRMENRWNLTFQKTQFALYFLFGLVGLAWLVDRWAGSNLFASDFWDMKLLQWIVGASFFLLMMTPFWLTLQFIKDKHFKNKGL